MGVAKKSSVDVDKIIKKTAKEMVKELERAKLIKHDGSTYFQKTEKLLYSYKDLLEAVKQKEKDIEFLQKNGLQQKSKSIVFYSTTGGSNGAVDQYLDILESYKASKERTERLVAKIERALEEIKDDRYRCIIESKYFEKMTNAEMEEKLNISESTIKRHKNRLVNRLQVLLFGADAFEQLTEL